MHIDLPQNVNFIIDRLYEHGFEAYAVGGCVRDSLLGRKPQDWDITTSAKPDQVKTIFNHTIEEKMLGTEAEGCMNSEDPVNLSTGNFIYEHEDLKVAGEIPLSFHRYYNSKDSRTGVLGRCFLHNYQIALEKEADGTIGVRQADGQVNHYDRTVSENGREELTRSEEHTSELQSR